MERESFDRLRLHSAQVTRIIMMKADKDIKKDEKAT